MRRLLLTLAALAACAPAAAATAAPAAVVRLAACASALAPADRSATFEARVQASRRTARMQVRFALEQRPAGDVWRRVPAAGLDTWLTSDAGVRRYVYAKTIRNLLAPAEYRVIVRFRWVGADGATLRRRTVTSPRCRQADLRPDLEVEAIRVLPARDPLERRYVVAARNRGATAAGPFALALRAGAATLDPAPVAGLGAGATTTLVLPGPACAAGEELEATADPDRAVDERAEDDNVLRVPCPV